MERTNRTNYKGICAFDVDNTLTCGNRRDLRAAVQECRRNNYAVAIVTARKVPTLAGIWPRKHLGFPKKFEVRYGKFADFSERAQAVRKAEQLRDLQRKYNDRQKTRPIPSKKVYLFDDKRINVAAANRAGFRGVHVNRCNLNETLVQSVLQATPREAVARTNTVL